MPIATDEIISLLSAIANEEQMKVTITQCIKCGFIAGCSAAVGGLLGGPIGVAAGAAVGGAIAAASSKKFMSVVEILAIMETEKKEYLAENVRKILGNIHVTDAAVLLSMVSNNTVLKKEIVNAISSFLQNEMQMALTN